jgi:Trk K+ transport system NAD-binding subunit
MAHPVILCGLGRVGWRVLDYFRAAGMPVVAIDTHCKPDDHRLQGVPLICGDFRQPAVLEKAGIANARGVVICTSDDLANVSTALMVRHLHPEIRVVVRVFNQNLLPRLGKTVHNVIPLSTSALTAPLLALTALTGAALGTFTLGEERHQVAEIEVDENSPIVNWSVAGVAGSYQARVLAHFPTGSADRFLVEVDPDAKLAVGDRIVLASEPRNLAPLFEHGGGEVRSLLWAGWLRRFGRMMWRYLTEVDLSVKVCTITLVVVVLVSTLIYHLGVDMSLARGLFRTISVMSTGGDLHEEELSGGGWQKVFVSFLRLFGAALTAAFTAIVTNYLLRARLGGVLEVRRIPDGGHVVVVGLGNLGFRVVEELLRYDEPIVVIEASPDSRFVATTRRLGVPVIAGDATVLEVLRQARADRARAVVIATSNELANLEIALLVRELNPAQRVVVRLTDHYLAETLKNGANIRLALSIPDLAAPAFLAALYGDRVQSVFMVKGRMLAVVELVVQADDAVLREQLVQALAVDYQLLPVALRDRHDVKQRKLLEHRLADGDRLTVITELKNLERLLRRERAPADCALEVTGFNLPAQNLVLELLRVHRGQQPTREDLNRHLPFVAGENLTRGGAEVLAQQWRREGVHVKVRVGEVNQTVPS